jgi:hypothetical protein
MDSKILQVLLCLTLIKSVVAGGNCDQNDCQCRGDCGLVPDGSINPELKCEYKVTHRQMLKVSKPAILQVEIGEQCPRDEKGWLHDESCRICEDHHVPCQGQFTACGGCCGPVEVSITQHRCRDVKDYFKMENWCDLSLDTASVSTEDDNSDPDVNFNVDDKVDDEFHSGVLVDGCDVDKNRVKCDKLPAVVDFNCRPCNKGSPMLMKKCCDECVKFSKSEKLARYPGIRAFVACQGCETTTINMPKGGGSPMDWKYKGGYNAHSRDAVVHNMDEWIEDNICTLFEPSRPKCQRRLLDHQRRLLDHNQTSDLITACNTTTTATTATTATTTTTTTLSGADKGQSENHDLPVASASASMAVGSVLRLVMILSIFQTLSDCSRVVGWTGAWFQA